MRRSLRFFSSCSSSSLIRFPIERKVLACHTAQDHPFQPVQIVKTTTAGLAHGPQQRFPWILPHQAQQLPQGKREHPAGEDHFPMLMWARAMTGLFSVVVGVLVFCWSRRLFGVAGGFVSLIFFVFS